MELGHQSHAGWPLSRHVQCECSEDVIVGKFCNVDSSVCYSWGLGGRQWKCCYGKYY